MDVFDAIRNRRSVKPDAMKSDTPVPRELLERVLEAANWAPSHGHTEPWRFVVFEGEARRGLVEAAVSTLADPGEATLAPDDPRRHKMEAKMLAPPTIVAILCQPASGEKIFEHEEIISVGIAVQNMHLAAQALGLAGFWTSGKKCFHDKVARFLAIEAPARCLGFFYIGWPRGEWPEGTRGPWQDKVDWRS